MGGISAALACRSTPLRPVPVVGPSILSGCRVHSGWHRGWRSTLRRPPCHPRVLVGCLRPVCYFGPATDAGATQTACCLWRRRGSAPVTLPAALRRGIRQRAHALPDCCALPVPPFSGLHPGEGGLACWHLLALPLFPAFILGSRRGATSLAFPPLFASYRHSRLRRASATTCWAFTRCEVSG